MKLTVTRQDIEDGIHNITSVCGCPIWHCLRRKLGIQDEDDLEFRDYYSVKIGRRSKVVIDLPKEAVKWQRQAAKHPERAKPITFEATLRERA